MEASITEILKELPHLKGELRAASNDSNLSLSANGDFDTASMAKATQIPTSSTSHDLRQRADDPNRSEPTSTPVSRQASTPIDDNPRNAFNNNEILEGRQPNRGKSKRKSDGILRLVAGLSKSQIAGLKAFLGEVSPLAGRKRKRLLSPENEEDTARCYNMEGYTMEEIADPVVVKMMGDVRYDFARACENCPRFPKGFHVRPENDGSLTLRDDLYPDGYQEGDQDTEEGQIHGIQYRKAVESLIKVANEECRSQGLWDCRMLLSEQMDATLIAGDGKGRGKMVAGE
ncbi:hypothetical protein PT974_08037 [Cladobotryum mycophilum]|uniref:Uncharacterized protein n=1 Tax=Cladobotryum mycophilum TaxID=491253 RepID=A0ABR0SD63_9HYPO